MVSLQAGGEDASISIHSPERSELTGPILRQRVRELVQRYSKELELPKGSTRPHAVRATAATNALEHEADRVDFLRRFGTVESSEMELRASGAVRTQLRRSEAHTRSGSGRVSLPPPIATGGRLDFLVPISAKKIAAGCDFVRQREKKDLRKLHGVARLRKARKKSGGFDSLHPLQ